MMIQALIFDFDGLILDTEQSEFQAWQEVYAEHNVYLPLEQWALCIGGAAELFDPYAYLESLVGRSVQREAAGEAFMRLLAQFGGLVGPLREARQDRLLYPRTE